MSNEYVSIEKLSNIAKKQKLMIYAVAGQLLLNPIANFSNSMVTDVIIGLAAIALLVLIVVSIVRLSLELNHIAFTILYGVIAIVPLLNLLVLLKLNRTCIKILKMHGIKMGFFGVSQEEIRIHAINTI